VTRSRYTRGDFAPTYVRTPEEHACEHVLHAHVVYDSDTDTYRAQLRCRCRARTKISRRHHDTHAPAEAEAAALARAEGIKNCNLDERSQPRAPDDPVRAAPSSWEHQ
jgi:hypothetical protein